MRLLGCLALGVFASATGCFLDESYSRYRGNGPPTPEYDPATTATAARVDSLGREILAANPEFATRPTIHTLGVVDQALFHRGDRELFISEGLVTRCANDGELAALLCVELGQMETERQALDAADWRGEDERLPLGVELTPDSVGGAEPPDFTRTAELARHEQRMRSRRAARFELPDPRELTRQLLSNAGYDDNLLATVEPWVREVKRARPLEGQFSGTPPTAR